MLAGALLFTSPVARAGCLNPCEMRVSEVQVEPPLGCGTVKVNAQTCDCSVWFSILNGCQQSIDTTAFTWDRCFPSGAPCMSIPPGDEGILEPPLTSLGHRDYSFVVSDADGPHTITFTSDVTAFDDSSCAFGARGSAPRPVWLGALGLVALAFAWRTRMRR